MFERNDDIWCDLCGDGMKSTYVVLQGKRLDCCHYCKSLTPNDESYRYEENQTQVREVYGDEY